MFFRTPADAVLSSPFQPAGPRPFTERFLWARMRLFEDRIEFVRLTWAGLHRRTLPLERIARLRWRNGDPVINFTLFLHDSDDEDESERIRVWVKAPGLWKHEVEARATNLAPAGADLPEELPSEGKGPAPAEAPASDEASAYSPRARAA